MAGEETYNLLTGRIMEDLSEIDPLITSEYVKRFLHESEIFIMNFCYTPDIPERLYNAWVKLAKARMLNNLRGKYQISSQESPLTDNTLVSYTEAEYAIKFASASTSSGSNASVGDYLAWLENSAIQELIPFKRMKFVGGYGKR